MAGYDFEFYETGRISVTAGQKAFTGSGTAWKIRGCEGALVIVAGAGAVNFVSALSTDAAGEFRVAWTGPTLANAQYTMWLPSAVAATALANHQRLAEIIATIQAAQPESNNLSSLANLAGDAGTLVRFLAGGAFDLIKPSEVGIQDPNGSLAKLAALTLVANKILRTNASGNASQGDITNAAAALLALAGAANKLPFFDGANSAALTDLTAFARTLLGANSADGARGAIGAQTNLENTNNIELGRQGTGDRSAYIDLHAEGAPGSVDRSARIVRNIGTNGNFSLENNGSGSINLTANSGVNVTVGPLSSPWAYNNTTVSAANVFITSGNSFARSTSSGIFKTDVEDLDDEHRDLILGLRPVWYRSLCELDDPEWSYYCLIAEEVAAIDPRLVHWQTSETTYEEKRSLVTVEDIVTDEGTGEKTVANREVEIVEQVPNEVELETPRPVGVMYDRLVPHLIAKIQELTSRLDAMESGL